MTTITLPGLIDAHVHLRDPGQTHKEDFYTGTCAALAGGFTTVLDMPNNLNPITSLKRLSEKIDGASKKIVCDTGFYFGSLGDNLEEFDKVRGKVFGLKLYLNITTGKFLIDKKVLADIYSKWDDGVILVHSEADTVEDVIKIISQTGKSTHICHVSGRFELQKIIEAKEKGLPITCGVTPHHLFLSREEADKLGPFGQMKPPIEKGFRAFLWSRLDYIDIIESDHAPHSIKEKESDEKPFGVPGLETTLPLLLTAVNENKLTIERIIELCFNNPKNIFRVPDSDSKIEVDLNEEWEIRNGNLLTKCKWSPFNGWKVRGKVKKVYIRGKKVYYNGDIVALKGSGNILNPLTNYI